MQRAENQILTIFGASGDLTRRKLIPALYHLYLQKLLPEEFAILGAGRKSYTDKEFRNEMNQALEAFSSDLKEEKRDGLEQFSEHLYYVQLDTGNPEDDKIMKVGGVYTVGLGVHDDNVTTRFHHVSFPLTLGIGAEADITAIRVN